MTGWWRSLTPKKRVRVTVIALATILVAWIVYRAADTLVPFLLGLLLAILMYPLVQWLERHMPAFLGRGKLARALAIILVYLLGLGVLAGFFAYLVPTIVNQFGQLIEGWPVIVAAVRDQLRALLAWYERSFALEFRLFVAQQLRNIGSRLGEAIQSGLISGLRVIGNFFAVLAGYVVIPFWVFFVLFDAHKYQQNIVNALPASIRADVINLARIADYVLHTYLAGQLLKAFVTGVLSGIGLALVGVNLAALLGFLVAIGDLIPTLGPILAAIPAVIVATIERPIQGLWALLILFGIQQLEVNTYGPRIVGGSVRLTPATIILLLVVAWALWGVLGLVFVIPLAVVLRDALRYILIRTSSEQITADEALAQFRQERHQSGG